MRAKVLIRSAFVGATAIAAAASWSAVAQAQDLIDFLWGGGEEWGGSRQTVKFDPQYRPGQIIVSFGDRRLYLIERPGLAISYPVAAPREQSRWQGKTTVTSKRENPSWTPTPEMFKENPKLPSWVPGGHPMNPLGVRAMYLGTSAYRIHGTDAPWTIGQAVSKGCIRMYNEDVLDLYPRIPVGTVVTVTWERFKTSPASTEIARVPGTSKADTAAASARGQGYQSQAQHGQGEPTPVVEAAPPDDAPPAPGGVIVEDYSAPVDEKPQVRKQSVVTPEESYDEGYTVDNSNGRQRITKIGRKPLVTRTSAQPE